MSITRHLTNKTPFRLLILAGLLIGLISLLAACGDAASSPTPVAPEPGATAVRIGLQKGGTLAILKAQGSLEKRLESQGVKVTWTEFPAGPQLLEALNTGNIDFGTTGEAPPIFALAAGAPLVYAASTVGNPQTEAIIVPKNSSLKSVADLKGKKVALNKGSNVHYLLLKALEEAKLSYSDIEPVYLAPGDARVAFEGGKVDAWVIWDPFLTSAIQSTEAKVLRDGTNLVSNRGYYLTSRSFATNNTPLLKATLEEIQKVEKWEEGRPDEVAAFLSPIIGIDESVLKVTSRRQKYGLEPVDAKVLAEQQKIGDAFFSAGLIPKQLNTQEAAWNETLDFNAVASK
jgi:sulfonate transport system substrate-binding protein